MSSLIDKVWVWVWVWVWKIRSETILIHHFLPRPGVITSDAEEAWPAQIAVPGQLWDSGYTSVRGLVPKLPKTILWFVFTDCRLINSWSLLLNGHAYGTDHCKLFLLPPPDHRLILCASMCGICGVDKSYTNTLDPLTITIIIGFTRVPFLYLCKLYT